MDDFPNLKAWEDRMLKRPGVEKGRHVPDKHFIKEMMASPEEQEKVAKQASSWIMAGQKADAGK